MTTFYLISNFSCYSNHSGSVGSIGSLHTLFAKLVDEKSGELLINSDFDIENSLDEFLQA